jgi:diguanylate cyclase (GGDEF)-like protein/PAS domain S-box-containing protein
MGERNILDFFPNVSRAFSDALLNEVQDGICCVDREKRVVFWNKAAEKLSGFGAAETLGRNCARDLALYADAEGRNACGAKCPVDLTLQDGKIRVQEMYLQHKDGYRIAVQVHILPIFQEGGEVAGAAEVFADTAPRISIPLGAADLERMGLLDKDTGIPSRKSMEMQLATRLLEFQKYGMPFGLLYVDIDNYNKILEKYGRFNAGKLLRTTGRALQKNIRYLDVVGRWNTDEFLVLLLNIDENRLDIVANKLRLLVEESYIMVETGALSTTVSIGASLVQRYDTTESLVKRAEQLMMHSKWRGKNKVSLSFVQQE